MTTVRLQELNGGCLFSCEGHAGYAPRGRDIVCAGVSALCIALVRRLEDMALEGIVRLPECEVGAGEVRLRVETDENDKMSEILLRNTFAAIMAGFGALEENYAEYVMIT